MMKKGSIPRPKSVKKVRRSKKEIQMDKNKILNLFVMNSDDEVEILKLETEYSKIFINRFGLENIPDKDRFLEFKNVIGSEV